MTLLQTFEHSSEIYKPEENHPNWKRWTESEQTAVIRGELVVRLLTPLTDVHQARVLEIGCGYGGTALAFARRGCSVTATDADPRRINSVQSLCGEDTEAAARIQTMIVMGEELPFADNSFDIVVLQGVLEHTQLPQQVLKEASRVLDPGGWTFLTIPNRFSFFNLAADPHWGLPLIGIFNRSIVSFIITKLLRREKWRPDFAALISLTGMRRMMKRANLRTVFLNKEAAQEMFRDPRTVTWTAAERRTVRLLAHLRLDGPIVRWTSNRWSMSSFFLIPTWYMAGQKEIS
ncbi:MAG: class I SAM-dependent methyltransferase [Ignavibacteriales bacterium]|nr:class I SAM-dependent methyltransferase [Ignavibacteriales bacterium]